MKDGALTYTSFIVFYNYILFFPIERKISHIAYFLLFSLFFKYPIECFFNHLIKESKFC